MYKYLLCWRYLRTRYIALASIISVMLGVATMIVVNSVMAGFSTTMQRPAARDALGHRRRVVQPQRLRQLRRGDGRRSDEVAGDDVEAMAPDAADSSATR